MVKLVIGAGVIIAGAIVTAATCGTCFGFFAAFGGTIVRFGRFAHIDASTKSLLHLAALGFNHIPIGTIVAGFIGGF